MKRKIITWRIMVSKENCPMNDSEKAPILDKYFLTGIRCSACTFLKKIILKNGLPFDIECGYKKD